MNNVLNTKMRTLLIKKVISGFELDAALQQLLIEGFVGYNGCYFLTSLYKQQSHIHASGSMDHTGYECFINSIHIDDYVTTNVL